MAIFRRKKVRAASDSPSPVGSDLEGEIQQTGRELLEAARGYRSGMLSKKFWSDQLMNWTMKDEGFKVQMFRFVDAFPMFKTPEAVHQHLVDYLTQPGVTLPPGLSLGIKAGGDVQGHGRQNRLFANRRHGQEVHTR